MIESTDTNKAKTNQMRNLCILIGIVIIGFLSLLYMMSGTSSNDSKSVNEKPNFTNPLDHVDPESIVLERTQKQLNDSAKETEHLQQELTALSGKKQEDDQAAAGLTEQLKNRLDMLEKQVNTEMHHSDPLVHASDQADFVSRRQRQDDFRSHEVNLDSIREDKLSLLPIDIVHESKPAIKNPETYVPAGSFVKAVMIGGADASAAVNAQSNPTPMIFRIVEGGTLPNHQHSHLKDCFVTAAVVGDISSERGLIRLENLSCTLPNKEIVDQPVEGTIFGPEGKNGVRGIALWRESALLKRAFAAGALSGLSEGLSQSFTSNAISPEGTVQAVNSAKVFPYAGAKGVGKAMDKLADYNIERAEQYHPVIQLSAGTVVDVVFLKGFFIDGKKHENQTNPISTEMVAPAPTLFPPTENSEDPQPLPLSDNEIRKIEENSKQLGLRVSRS
ncbi:MAG: TraB/VirB10 family protein [Nitrosomonas sp.]|nr:TraB/VirB10 family protein [Nitrosomonas sp.]